MLEDVREQTVGIASRQVHRSGGLSAPLLRSGPSTAEVACSGRSPPQVRAPFRGSPVGSSRIRPAARRRTRPSSETHNLRAASRPGARIISSPRTSRPLHRPWRCGSGRSSARTPRRASGRQPYPRSTDQDHSRSGEPVYGRRRPDHRPEAGSEVHNIPNPERMGCSRRRCARVASGLESAPPRFHSLVVPQHLLRRLSTKGLRCADGAPPAVTLIARFPCRTDVRISGRNLEDQ